MDTLMGRRVFRQVVEAGSFVAAAERLDLSTAMVSKHVMHIEKRLGALIRVFVDFLVESISELPEPKPAAKR
ncbi:MAG TPA: LysR family transcriptional regulator [Steroidobacteraceae bacterium]|nr:LysR family transcriptional regulator [Steroidobacteraceae bacterium]